jgi:hypothetical protein
LGPWTKAFSRFKLCRPGAWRHEFSCVADSLSIETGVLRRGHVNATSWLLLSTESRQKKKTLEHCKTRKNLQNVNTNWKSVIGSLIGTCMYGFPHVTRNHLTWHKHRSLVLRSRFDSLWKLFKNLQNQKNKH